MDLRGFSGNNSLKKWTYVVIPGIIKNKMEILFRENVEKNGDTWFFLVLVQDSEFTFVISVTAR